jgi:FtsP/CotA-like multicopper oxidase with cupredoxin domain
VLRATNPIQPLPRNVRKRYLTVCEIQSPAGPVMGLLNNRMYDTTNIETPKVDAAEEWNIINLTADTHPIHLHLIGFQVAERQPIDVPAYLLATYGAKELTAPNVSTGPWPPPAPDAFFTGPVQAPAACEAGWKDTVQVHPGYVTRLLVPFGPSAAAGVPFGQQHRSTPLTGDYTWHCHILDHEDNEMMLPYRVTL